MQPSIPTKYLLNTPVTCLTFEEQIMLMLRWAKARESKTVCLANVHMLMEAYWDRNFAKILEKADMVTPDGMPLVWMLKKQGIQNQNQVAGLDVFLNLCELAQQCQIGIYFVGSEADILNKIEHKLEIDYPILSIAGMESLPYISIKEIDKNIDLTLIERINKSGAGIVFVCLGCPKQEIWMNQHKDKIKAVMIGVGAVFSMYAGLKPRAPYWLQKIGFEWLYRLLQEPKRLWVRYGKTIPPFLYLAIRQLLVPYRNKLNQLSVHSVRSIDITNLNNSPICLGQILVRQGILTESSLNQVLAEQSEFPDLKLGQILINKNLISLHQLKYYLKNQKIMLGEILVERKLIKTSQLDSILNLEKERDRRIGEILIERRLISEKQLEDALMEQYWRRRGLWLHHKRIEKKAKKYVSLDKQDKVPQ